MSVEIQILPQERKEPEIMDCCIQDLKNQTPKITNIPLHAFPMIKQRSLTVLRQSEQKEIMNHVTIIQKQLAQFKLTEET